MWYWDYTPSWWGRVRPLTKAQIWKIQEAYKKADSVTAEIRAREAEEQKRIDIKIEEDLNLLT